MCNDPNHTKELTELVAGTIRVETKIDNILSITSDHESRIRLAESTLVLQRELERNYVRANEDIKTLDSRLTPLEQIATDNSKTLASFKKVLWAIALSVASGVGILIVDTLRRGQ